VGYFLYKGLKKPLVFFGLKDKYIFYAIGSIVGTFLLVAILSTIMGAFGLLIGAIIGGICLWLTFKIQDSKGLYNKTKNENELHIFPVNIKNGKHLKKRK
jgi:hypothetical protein